MVTKRKSVKKAMLKKSVKKAIPKKSVPTKFYMVGDESSPYDSPDRVSVCFPTQVIVDYCNTVLSNEEAAEKKLLKLEAAIAKRTSRTTARIFVVCASTLNDSKTILRAIRTGRSCVTGEDNYLAGWGPTRAAAWAKYESVQVDEDFDQMDW